MSEVKLNVKLLSHTLDPEITVALGGRLCYSDSGISQLREAVEPRAEEFVDKLMGFGHLSPIEHASFTFGVEGVSRALLAQITRHRIASFSVQSQRYVKKEELTYILPDTVKALGPEAVAEYEEQMAAVSKFYQGWLDQGLPPEDARFVLPNAAETRMILTMNARELLHFLELRCCGRAQWEIRRLAWCMLGIARREAPALFKNAGPACLCGRCGEGRMSCGQTAKVKALSQELFALCEAKASDAAIVAWAMENI